MKKQILAVATAALVSVMSFIPAFAADGTVEVTGGTLGVTPAAISIAGVTLNGANHPDVAGTTSNWTVVDPTGTGAGYHVTIAATDFVNQAVVGEGIGKVIAVGGFEATLTSTNIVTVTGNTKPVTNMATAKVLGSAQSLATAAANTGMGTYTLLPTFTLDVPLSTYAGSYKSVVTVDIVAGP